MVRTADELHATARYQELSNSKEDVPSDTLHELAEQMTSREAVEQLTATVDRILATGTQSEQRAEVAYKIFEEDAEEGLPRVTIERDLMPDNEGRGDHFKVSFDYRHPEIHTDTYSRETTYTGDDYEWREKYDTSIQHFGRNGEEEPYVDPSGEVRYRASDEKHRGKTVFNKMSVREINSRPVEDNFAMLRLAERLRRREEGRERTKSQIDEDIRQKMAERQVAQEPTTEQRDKKFGKKAVATLARIFRIKRK